MLGVAKLEPGDGRKYPRTTGFGSNRKPHPDGGTNETAAWVLFRPFAGLNIEFQGRIYCERYIKDGQKVREFSISLPFLKVDRKDTAGRDAVEALKVKIRDQYRKALTDGSMKVKTAAEAPASATEWREADE